jgi:hypothetical protein
MEHPMFQKMLKIASHAHNKIKLPGRTTTHELIIKKFKIDLLSLRFQYVICILFYNVQLTYCR